MFGNPQRRMVLRKQHPSAYRQRLCCVQFQVNDTALQYVMFGPPAGTEEAGKLVLPN